MEPLPDGWPFFDAIPQTGRPIAQLLHLSMLIHGREILPRLLVKLATPIEHALSRLQNLPFHESSHPSPHNDTSFFEGTTNCHWIKSLHLDIEAIHIAMQATSIDISTACFLLSLYEAREYLSLSLSLSP